MGVHDRPLGGDDPEAAIEAIVDGDVRLDLRAQRVGNARVGHRERAVDGRGPLLGRAREINHNRFVADPERDRHPQRLVGHAIVVEEVLGFVDAPRKASERGARPPFRVVVQRVAIGAECVRPERSDDKL